MSTAARPAVRAQPPPRSQQIRSTVLVLRPWRPASGTGPDPSRTGPVRVPGRASG